tara:strand:+ start:426 stop:2426 length:2001 start_codon:yes stop_codon:yes gene_type:complete
MDYKDYKKAYLKYKKKYINKKNMFYCSGGHIQNNTTTQNTPTTQNNDTTQNTPTTQNNDTTQNTATTQNPCVDTTSSNKENSIIFIGGGPVKNNVIESLENDNNWVVQYVKARDIFKTYNKEDLEKINAILPDWIDDENDHRYKDLLNIGESGKLQLNDWMYYVKKTIYNKVKEHINNNKNLNKIILSTTAAISDPTTFSDYLFGVSKLENKKLNDKIYDNYFFRLNSILPFVVSCIVFQLKKEYPSINFASLYFSTSYVFTNKSNLPSSINLNEQDNLHPILNEEKYAPFGNYKDIPQFIREAIEEAIDKSKNSWFNQSEKNNSEKNILEGFNDNILKNIIASCFDIIFNENFFNKTHFDYALSKYLGEILAQIPFYNQTDFSSCIIYRLPTMYGEGAVVSNQIRDDLIENKPVGGAKYVQWLFNSIFNEYNYMFLLLMKILNKELIDDMFNLKKLNKKTDLKHFKNSLTKIKDGWKKNGRNMISYKNAAKILVSYLKSDTIWNQPYNYTHGVSNLIISQSEYNIAILDYFKNQINIFKTNIHEYFIDEDDEKREYISSDLNKILKHIDYINELLKNFDENESDFKIAHTNLKFDTDENINNKLTLKTFKSEINEWCKKEFNLLDILNYIYRNDIESTKFTLEFDKFNFADPSPIEIFKKPKEEN